MAKVKPLKAKALPVKIKSDRITLKKHELSLASEMFAAIYHDRQRLAKFMPWAEFTKIPADCRKYIRKNTSEWKACRIFDFAMFRNSDKRYLGNIGVHHIDWNTHVCEIGYWIIGDGEGQGFVREAVSALSKALFRLGFNRIEIRCNAGNARSANVPLACGFQLEGTLRQQGVDMGQFRDTLVFGKLKSEA